ncbi:morphogenesis protein [Bacillus phage vB_BsuP-Goe15]|nr:morphogenesis protein [Bacillus phage vB_BsuP-Goe15]
MVYVSNKYLTISEMKVNAQYILNYLTNNGWTKQAVCGMLGNMQSESTINPGLWQNLDEGNTSLGFGLVQWTPASNYINWANSQGLPYKNMDSELKRIIWEVNNNAQWINLRDMTFKEYIKSTKTPRELAMIFLASYERPKNPNQPERGDQAEYWYKNLSGGGGGGLQLAQFPMDVINITQGENGSFSHKGTLCIDFVGKTEKYPYYAPCDCTCVWRGDASAYLAWTSDKEVMCADGSVRYITWVNVHESPLPFDVGKKLKKGDLMGHTGIGGNVTGDHWHFNVIDGKEYQGWTKKPDSCLAGTELHIYDVFAVNNVEIINGNGYDWKTSDWQDGDGGDGGDDNDNNKTKDLITLLLSDALHGWKV